MSAKAKIGILGASGYTGAELVRLLIRHPFVELALLTADRRAGKPMSDVFPQFAPYTLPMLARWTASTGGARARSGVLRAAARHHTDRDQKFAGAGAGGRRWSTSPPISASPIRLRMSAGTAMRTRRPNFRREAVYGLTEMYRAEIKAAQLVANPGCYTSCAELALIPLLKASAIDPGEIVIDAKSGMTGAGRAAREEMLFSEVSEGFHAYGVGHHRHMAELDQEFSKAAGRDVVVSFTPHLVPMNRGILSTIYVRGPKATPQDLHALLLKSYANEPFVHVLPFGTLPQTRHVRGSNMTFIGVAADRIAGRAIIGSALDNLTKGASGQAVQNMNLMLGFPETTGLEQVALFP